MTRECFDFGEFINSPCNLPPNVLLSKKPVLQIKKKEVVYNFIC